ncbi:MAG: efflux RND transporter periplasmic adaptor subunit [Fibrobacterota bacterium]|nr:efflux RND transporter periplasmic adaptor subunit [Fibrobacterota bacterium]QQS04526.1 MAG: efflux RND transporter periplasmic adaptor subunit [Fibrobacterota bacterium]
MNRLAQHLLRSTIFVAVAMLAGCGTDAPDLIGMADGREILVSAKIAGRLASVRVSEGDQVKAGDTLAVLGSPEVSAKVEQAAGAAKSASARLRMARKGARDEEVRMATTQLVQATEARKLAEATWKRVAKLLADSAVPRQQAEEAEFRWRTAQETESAAAARLDMVKNGARPEELEAAEGLLQSASNALSEARSWQKETVVLAPCDGIVQKRYLGAGEIMGAGSPILVLIRPQDTWVALPVREDQLAAIQVGSTLIGRIPALGMDSVEFKVTWMTSMGDFATWRSTNRKGDADLRSFEVRLMPKTQAAGLLPGMTVRFAGK